MKASDDSIVVPPSTARIPRPALSLPPPARRGCREGRGGAVSGGAAGVGVLLRAGGCEHARGGSRRPPGPAAREPHSRLRSSGGGAARPRNNGGGGHADRHPSHPPTLPPSAAPRPPHPLPAPPARLDPRPRSPAALADPAPTLGTHALPSCPARHALRTPARGAKGPRGQQAREMRGEGRLRAARRRGGADDAGAGADLLNSATPTVNTVTTHDTLIQ